MPGRSPDPHAGRGVGLYGDKDQQTGLSGPHSCVATYDGGVAETEHRSHKSERSGQPLGKPTGSHRSPTGPKSTQELQITEGSPEASKPLHRGSGFIRDTRRSSCDLAPAGARNPRRVLPPELTPQVGQGPVQTIGLAQALGDRTPAPFDAWTDPGPRAPLDAVPAWLRLPGEEGHIPMDRNMRPVTPPGAGP